MTGKDVKILIDYSYWARDRLLEAVAQLSHEQFTRDHLASLTSGWRDLETQIRAYFASVDDRALERVLDYKSTAGVAGASVLWHMFQHVVNHSTYHRGQVTTMLRQLGATPPKAMDLITFYRERSTPAA